MAINDRIRSGWGSRAGTALLAALVMLAAAVGPARDAVAQTPSAEQMEMPSSNLPPDQQQAILEELGGGSPRRSAARSGPAARRKRCVPRPTRSVDGSATDAYTSTGVSTDEIELRPREPRIRGNDSVLFDDRDQEARSGRRPDANARANQAPRATAGAGACAATPTSSMPTANLRILGVAPISLAGPDRGAGDRAPQSVTRCCATSRSISRLLPLEKLDAEALRPFGYDLFAGVPSTYAPVNDMPVPSSMWSGPATALMFSCSATPRDGTRSW
jgi:polysaccharide biosynthesis/export protein